MKFIRFVLGRKRPDSGVEEGVYRLAYKLRRYPAALKALLEKK